MSLTKRHVGGGLQSNKWLPNVSHHNENTRKSRPGGNGSRRQGGQGQAVGRVDQREHFQSMPEAQQTRTSNMISLSHNTSSNHHNHQSSR